MSPQIHSSRAQAEQRIKAARRQGEQRAALHPNLPAPDAPSVDRGWQLGFLLRFTLHVAFYGWVAWLVLGKPESPIRWLQ